MSIVTALVTTIGGIVSSVTALVAHSAAIWVHRAEMEEKDRQAAVAKAQLESKMFSLETVLRNRYGFDAGYETVRARNVEVEKVNNETHKE